MGQQNSFGIENNTSLALQQQLPIGKVYKDQKTNLTYFIKEYSYTSEDAFQKAFLRFSTKLTQKNQNILDLQKANSKVQNTFCSTFYKIILVFEYINHTLADQIQMRNKQNRNFEEKQIWSILFHCTLAIAHLRRTQGIQHSAIDLKDIRLSEDGILKIIPSQMIGISLEHDQKQGTTKKMAMTILGCMLMKQVTNQSNQYLQALIDKTKCSKQLKKVLYLMIMQDSTFKQLQQYLFKLASDENDSIAASGVSTPVLNSNKKGKTQQSIKANLIIEALSVNEHLLKNNQVQDSPNNQINSFLAPDEQDEISNYQLPQFLNNHQIQNPDENDQQKNSQLVSSQEDNRRFTFQTKTVQRNNEHLYTQTPLRNHSHMKNLNQNTFTDQNDDTVRVVKTKTNNPVKESESLYTDPKLLDLIKKDLQQIQQKSRASFGSLKQPEQINSFNYKQSSSMSSNQNELLNVRVKKDSIYNISSTDFNLKPITIESNEEQKSKNLQSSQITQKKSQFSSINEQQKQNPEGSQNLKLNSQGSIQTQQQKKLKSIQNIPKRFRQQECFGNILDEEASFKKVKNNKKNTGKQSQVNKELMKENIFEQTDKQTKRLFQNQSQQVYSLNNFNQSQQLQNQNNTHSYSLTSIGQNCRKQNTFESNKKVVVNKGNSQKKLIPQALKSQNLTQIQLSPHMELVTQTYQKGQYKGYKLNGLRHGTGTFFYRQGGKYVGQWKQNKMNGKGTLYYPNDQIAYEGNWKDDQLHGYGVLFNQQVSQLTGSFQYQDWTAVEQYWIKYQGEFNMDNKQGKGKWYLSNGQVFEGHFKDDMVDGQGVLSRKNGSRIRGIWRKNKLIRLY